MRLILLLVILNLFSCNNTVDLEKSEADVVSSKTVSSSIQCPNNLATFLNDSVSFTGAILPQDFDARSLKFQNADLSFVDFSNVKNLTVQHLNLTRAIRGIKLPAGFNLTGFISNNKDLGDIDFTNTFGLTAKMLNDSLGYSGAILPAGMDLTNLDPTGRSINRLDFSQTFGLDPYKVLNSSDALAIVYPAGFFDSIDELNLSETETYRNNEKNESITFPTSMGVLEPQDAENFLYGNSWISYRSLQILDPDGNQVDEYLPVAFGDIDLSTRDTSSVNTIIDIDFRDIQNVDYNVFNNATFVDEITPPDNIEIDKLDGLYKVSGWNFTNISDSFFECQ